MYMCMYMCMLILLNTSLGSITGQLQVGPMLYTLGIYIPHTHTIHIYIYIPHTTYHIHIYSFLCSAVLGVLCKRGNCFWMPSIKYLGNFLIFLLKDCNMFFSSTVLKFVS